MRGSYSRPRSCIAIRNNLSVPACWGQAAPLAFVLLKMWSKGESSQPERQPPAGERSTSIPLRSMFVPNDQGIRSPQLRDSRGRLAEVSRISCLAGKNKEIVPNRIRHDRVNRVRINLLCAVKLTTMPATTMVADKLTTTRTVTLGQMCRVHLTRAAVTMTASASRERKLGMIVDALEGEEELVIKALDDRTVETDLVSGASILGDGRVVLILNLAAVVEHVAKARPEQTGQTNSGLLLTHTDRMRLAMTPDIGGRA